MKTYVTIEPWQRKKHLNGVLEVNREVDESPMAGQSEAEKYFLDLLSERGVICTVAVKGDYVVAYVVYELIAERIDTIHFEVRPEYQRTGVGTTLWNKLVEKLSNGKHRSISIRVKETDMRAHLFLKKMGAKVTKIIKNYYKQGENSHFFEFFSEKTDVPEEKEPDFEHFGPYVDKEDVSGSW